MAEPFVQAASRLAECCTLLAIGYNLKQAGILGSSDGETAIKVATTLTLPSAIVQALGNSGPLGGGAVSLLGVATVCVGAQLAATWLYVMHRPPRERAVLSGSLSGLSLGLWGYPAVEVFLGGPAAGAGRALQAVALADLVNHVAVWIGSYLFSAGAGPAFPASFPHEDGGDYRGQWRGMRKEGLGVYTYASGARYEGEWRNNVKEGRGVYHFPKGGVYEGEWAGGSMNGLGIRTFSTGQVKAGRWRDGQLEAPLELWQVALAADGAAVVAAAARSVEVGGGQLADAAQALAAQPTLWALLAGLAVNLAGIPLPTSVDVLTRVLATANAPLMLLAAGITLPPLAPPQGLRNLLPDVARLLGARLLVPLAVGLNLTVLMAASASGGGGGAFQVASTSLVPLAAALMALLAPVPPQALTNARRFRLNETTAAAITTMSYFVCVPLMMLAGVAACAAGLTAPPPPVAAGGVAAAVADVRPLGVFTLAAVAAVSAAVVYVAHQSQPASEEPASEDRRVRMVYVGPAEVTAATTAADESGAGRASSTGPGTEAAPSGGPKSGEDGGSGGGAADGGSGSRRPPTAAAVPAVVARSLRGAASCWSGWTRWSGCGGGGTRRGGGGAPPPAYAAMAAAAAAIISAPVTCSGGGNGYGRSRLPSLQRCSSAVGGCGSGRSSSGGGSGGARSAVVVGGCAALSSRAGARVRGGSSYAGAAGCATTVAVAAAGRGRLGCGGLQGPRARVCGRGCDRGAAGRGGVLPQLRRPPPLSPTVAAAAPPRRIAIVAGAVAAGSRSRFGFWNVIWN